MFETKKALRGKLDLANTRLELIEDFNNYLFTKNKEWFEEIRKLRLDLKIEIRQKEELSKLLDDLQKREGQAGHGSAAYIPSCTEECEYKKIGQSHACAYCIRNPVLSDLFEEAES